MMTEAQILEQSIIESKLSAGKGDTLTDRENMILLYSDFHKDAYGFRPRTINVYAMTTEELQADFDRFSAVCKENAEFEANAEAQAVEAFKAVIKKTILIGAGNEATALRWIAEAASEEYGWDFEHYLWNQGILHTEYGKQIGKKIAPIFGKIYARKQAA
jgi:hypothetical protein